MTLKQALLRLPLRPYETINGEAVGVAEAVVNVAQDEEHFVILGKNLVFDFRAHFFKSLRVSFLWFFGS